VGFGSVLEVQYWECDDVVRNAVADDERRKTSSTSANHDEQCSVVAILTLLMPLSRRVRWIFSMAGTWHGHVEFAMNKPRRRLVTCPN
jgi:hypothetical protein